MSTLQEVNGFYSITLPKALVLAKGWKKGTKLSFKLNDKGNIELIS